MATRIQPNRNIPNNGRDSRAFRQGEIWVAKDEVVSIPDSEITGRTVHATRPVVILSDYEDNFNPDYPMVLVAPMCSWNPPVTTKELSDVEVKPEDGVRRHSLVRVGLIQPILKVYLERQVGELCVDALNRVLATLDVILGAELPEEETDASRETAAGDLF